MVNGTFILGPCAAESREQVLSCAEQLSHLLGKRSELIIFRAGVWKPRTSPDSFQGAGDIALSWLQEVKTTYGFPVATEVATPEQVHKALAAGIDYLWIGARTSANPIAVQELANALIPNPSTLNPQPTTLSGIFIKNPVNEDTALWAGNIRRLQSALSSLNHIPSTINPQPSTLNPQPFIAAIHRGCGHRPCWRMPYELHKALPDIPILLDPSHMSGEASRIESLCQMAGTLGLDGLMVEIHPHPEQAFSDSRQQITPDHFSHILSTLPSETSETLKTPETPETLSWLRAIMDETDDLLWDVFLARICVSKEIGDFKRAHDLPVLQQSRWDEVLERRLVWAREHHLDEDSIRSIMEIIHSISRHAQQ